VTRIDYDEIAAETLAAIEEAGAEIKLIAKSNGAYDADESSVSISEENLTGVAIIVDAEEGEAEGTFISSDSVTFLIAAKGFQKPAADDELVFADISYDVVKTKTIGPNGAALIYRVLTRRG